MTPAEQLRRAAETLRTMAEMDPTLAGLLADWLDAERVECDALTMYRHNDGSGIPLRDAEREVYRNHPALALAEHINERTSR